MIDSILAVIDGIENAAARPRLRRCLPSLSKVLAHFDRRSVSAGLLIAAATPDGATVLHADGWPQLDRSPLKQGEVAAALSAAIEAGDMVDGDIILASLTILLGQRGIEAQELDAAQIVEDGGQPMVVALLEHALRLSHC